MNLQSPTGCTVHTSPHSLQLRAPAVLGPPPAPPKANVGWGFCGPGACCVQDRAGQRLDTRTCRFWGGNLSLSPACEAVSKLQTNSRIQLCSPRPQIHRMWLRPLHTPHRTRPPRPTPGTRAGTKPGHWSPGDSCHEGGEEESVASTPTSSGWQRVSLGRVKLPTSCLTGSTAW